MLIAAPVPLIWMIDPEAGRRDAVAMARSLGKQSGGDDDVDRGGSGAEGDEDMEGLLDEEDEER